MAKRSSSNRYTAILCRLFERHYRPGATAFEFTRDEIGEVTGELGVDPLKNLGDLLYSFRHRSPMPAAVAATAGPGLEWVIEAAGEARYRMAQRKASRIVANPHHLRIKIPDATPEIVAAHAKTDEQALLAKVRYNRLIDIFLRVTAYSLQSHLRTKVKGLGQIETDEVYVAVSNTGQQFAIPVQAKGGSDRIGVVQVTQDLALCRKAFPNLTPRPVAVQFIRDAGGETIAMFELTESNGDIAVVEERHYQLVPAGEISPEELRAAALRG